ncbi:MAG TPA: ABC transporter permease [Mycobacteriales bacterium]|nr:ABC transporter permease [Mycobacteriales bacterium]
MSTSIERPAADGTVGVGEPPTPGVEREFTVEARSQLRIIVSRFVRHRAAVVSLVVFLLIVLTAFIGGALWKYKYDQLTGAYYQGPSGAHPLGTDNISHDELALIFRGSQGSIEIALLVAVISTFVGTVVGSIAGYFGGLVDSALMRVCDLILTLPSIAIAIVIGYNLSNIHWLSLKLAVALLLALLGWPYVARVVRAQFLSLREKEFVEAARAMGASSSRIIIRHLLPNVLGPIIVNVTVSISVAILAESALSFLGFGVQPPDTSLGLLINASVSAADKHPWVFYSPGVVIILIALTVNFIGDGLRDALDPQQNRVRA